MPIAASAFLRSILDYAGMFPPARLPLHAALHQYRVHEASGDAAMLGRFVIPVTALDGLTEMLRGQNQGLRAALALKLENASLVETLDRIEQLGNSVRRCEQAAANFQVDSLETDLPGNLATAEVERCLAHLEKHFLIADNPRRMVFLEVNWRGNYEPLMKLAAIRGSWFGVKLRTGGLSADRVPPAHAIAAFLEAAALHRLSMKTTAGLHSPVPHDDDAVGTRLHGFLNVFTAAMLAYRDQAPRELLIRVLANFDYRDFRFEGERLHVGDVATFSADEIAALREQAQSFGSCSFDEPVERLKAHGILESATILT